ncbi:MAG: tetratricopeptide repeat protein [Bacteroidales bacterium]|nr:tetratricopeptide repeat protein [Bacteroidales bacterium]
MKQLYYVLLLFLVVLPDSIFTQDDNAVKRHYNSADRLLAMSDFEKAIPVLKELLTYDESNSNFNFKMGLSLVESYSHESAIPYLEKAVLQVSTQYISSYKHRNAPVVALEYLAKEYFYDMSYVEAYKTFNRLLDYADFSSEKRKEIQDYIQNCKSALELMRSPVKVKHLDFSEAEVVIPAAAHSPFFSPDESIYIYTHNTTTAEEEKAGIYNDDIFYSKLTSEGWLPAKPISTNINTLKSEASIGMHPNGKQLIIFRDDENDGNLYYSDLIETDVWTSPKKFPSPINSSYYESHATLSDDGNCIYFTSNRPDGFGGLDIYVSKKDAEGNWGDAINLGPSINSENHEESPHLQAGKNLLYFSSDRSGGMGGFDIYSCTIVKDTIVKNVKNIGYPINTPKNDLFFKTTLDGHTGYFSTPCKEGKGELKLNIVKFLDVKYANVKVRGVVINSTNDTLHDLDVSLFDIAKKDIIDSTKTDEAWGYYNFSLFPEKSYFVSFTYKDYVYFSNPFQIDKFFTNFTFSNIIDLDPIYLTDSTLRQNIGEFEIFKSNSSEDSSLIALSYYSQILQAKTSNINALNTKIGTIKDINYVAYKTVTKNVVSEITPIPVEPIDTVVAIETVEPEVEKVTYKPSVRVRTWRDIADSLKILGIENIDQTEYTSAIENLGNALYLYENHADALNAAVCNTYLAKAYYQSGDIYAALDYFQKAIDYYKATNKEKELADLYREFGLSYDALYNKSLSLDYLYKALELKRKLKDRIGEKQLLNDIANVYFKHSEYKEAIHYFEILSSFDNNADEKAELLNKIGLSHHKLQDFKVAIQYFDTSIALSETSKNEFSKSIYLNNQANSFFSIKDYNEALSLYLESTDIKRRINYQEGLALTLHNIGNTYQKLDKDALAQSNFEESQVIATSFQLTDIIAQNHLSLSELFVKQLAYDKALFHFSKYIDIVSPYINVVSNKQLAQHSDKYVVLDSDLDVLKRQLKKQEFIFQLEQQKRVRELELLVQKQRVQRILKIAIISLLSGIAIFFIFLLLRFKEKRKDFKVLTMLNAEIMQRNEEIITQKENLEFLHTELEKLSIVASETDSAVAIFDSNLRFEWINGGFTKHLGFTLEDIEQLDLYTFINDDFIKGKIIEGIENKQSIAFEYQKTGKDNLKIWTQSTLTPIFVDDQLFKIISIDSNIDSIKQKSVLIGTQNKQIEKQIDEIAVQNSIMLEQKNKIEEQTLKIKESIDLLKQTQNKLVESEKMASLGNLVAGVAHEVNTPVGIGIAASTSLITKTKMLKDLFEDKKMKQTDLVSYLSHSKDAARLIQTNLQRTGDLIKSFKRISVDEVSEQKRRFNINEYLKDIVKSLEPKVREKETKIEIQCPENIELNSYPGVFAQIFTNFIVNTILHGFKDRAGGTILINVVETNDSLLLQYKDDGNGMTPEVVEKVFNPFFTTNMQTGTGLGMNIVYNLVTQKLSGEIECTSTLNKGVTFNLLFPKSIIVSDGKPIVA